MFINRAELMKKSNGVYFPEEVILCSILWIFIWLFNLGFDYADNHEHGSENLQVVHTTPTGSGISTFEFRSTP